MNVLGMLSRIPVEGRLYRMHPDHYDASDVVGHPVLVTWVDVVRRTAEVVTRTTSYEARGPMGVVHRPGMHRDIDQTGWFRIAFPRKATFMAFNEPDTVDYGPVEDDVWTRVQAALQEREAGRRR